MLPITIRKRTITERDIPFIQAIIDEHWNKGRTRISQILCQQWNWLQPNGRFRDQSCRELLLTLQAKGFISLPPGAHNGYNDRRNKSIPLINLDQTPLAGKLSDFPPVRLKQVRHTSLERLYNSLIHHYHYLGYRQIVGAHLKYMAFIDDRPVACLGWGSAAWSVKSRDAFIGWNKPTKQKNLHFIVNNTRFVILPWMVIKYLASHLLALNAKKIASDWLSIYHHPLFLLETFVENDRFPGICYKAANWMRIGQTQGTSKRGNYHLFHGSIKDVYLYPLRKDFRQKLTE